MGLPDEAMKGLFSSLPASARHAISLCVLGGLIVFLFFGFVRDPLSAAERAAEHQGDVNAAQQKQIDKMNDVIVMLSQTQAVQAAAIERQARQQDRIEQKIDELRRGR